MVIEAEMFWWAILPPGQGDFTAEEDREKVDGIARRMLDARMHGHLKDGYKFGASFTRALSATYAKGHTATLNGASWMDEYINIGCDTWSPLHFAALEGNTDMIQHSISSGISVDVCTTGKHSEVSANKKLTPAGVAALYLDEDKAIATLLQLARLGANLFTKDARGFSLLHLAAHGRDRPGLVQFLLDRGLKVDERNLDGFTPLHVACESWNNAYKTAKVLLEHGADVNATEQLGRFPLLLACTFGHRKMVSCLIEAGAPPNRKVLPRFKERVVGSVSTIGKSMKPGAAIFRLLEHLPGMTALHMASFMGNSAAVEVLVQAGGDPTIRNQRIRRGKSLDAPGFNYIPQSSRVKELLQKGSRSCEF